jgi:hypothetical protein
VSIHCTLFREFFPKSKLTRVLVAERMGDE